MKYLLLVLLIPFTLFSQQRFTKKIGDFNKVKIFSGLKVKLIKNEDTSSQNYVEITGEKIETIVIKNVNGLLKFSILFPNVFDENQTYIKLHYSNDLDLIDANEGAIVISKDKIVQDFLEIKAQEGANIELRLILKTLKIKTISGAVITLSGKAQNQNVIANTGGIYEGFDLASKQTSIIAATGAETEINVSDLLEAKTKFKGFIIYLKEPKKVIKKIVFGGTICAKDDYRNEDGSRIYN